MKLCRPSDFVKCWCVVGRCIHRSLHLELTLIDAFVCLQRIYDHMINCVQATLPHTVDASDMSDNEKVERAGKEKDKGNEAFKAGGASSERSSLKIENLSHGCLHTSSRTQNKTFG